MRLLMRIVAAIALTLLAPSFCFSHALAPAFLNLTLGDDGTVAVEWTTAAVVVVGADFAPVFPDACRAMDEQQPELDLDRVITRWTLDCGSGGLIGKSIAVRGLATAYTEVVVRIELPDSTVHHDVLRADASALTVPESASWRDHLGSYSRLGVEHILSGPDHLLFVFGLLLLVHSFSTLIRTVTAFTVGHSLTLSAAALGFIPLWSAPVELGIALSIFALAVELAREPRAGGTLMQRRPWMVAGLFGLLHGAGFAGALREVGLPPSDIPLALLGFNVGIEIGQLLFIGAVLSARRVFAPLQQRLPEWTGWAPVYLLGCLSVFWCLERAAVVFGF
jgi:hydrogenase/urease accessory protein HupE